MDLRSYSDSIQQTLLHFLVGSENQPEDVNIHNANFTAYYITEMTKRWAERKYMFKKTGKEVDIRDAEKDSHEATQKFFKSQARRAAPARLAETMVDAEELFSFLEEKPKSKESPRDEDSSKDDEAEGEKKNGEVAPPEPELPDSHRPGAPPEGPQEYPIITPEELKKIRRG